MTPATEQKRRQLRHFIERLLAPEPAVMAVVGVGSIASGQMRPDSDIDAVIFLDPLDLYIAPAEAIWFPEEGVFRTIYAKDTEGIAFEFNRRHWQKWADPTFEWPEGDRADLHSGWIAYDPHGRAAQLIAQRTAYPDDLRMARLDEAIVRIEQQIGGGKPQLIWQSMGPVIAHDRLDAAYAYLVQALFAYNRHWRVWRSREMQALLNLPWLPRDFSERVLTAANGPGLDQSGFSQRVEMLSTLFDELLAQLTASGEYSAAPIDQAFIRSREEPGRSWNLEEWNKFHLARSLPRSDN